MGNTKGLIEKHIYSSNRNKIQVNLVKQLLVDRKLRVQCCSDYASTTQMGITCDCVVVIGALPSDTVVDVYLWRRVSPLCREYNISFKNSVLIFASSFATFPDKNIL